MMLVERLFKVLQVGGFIAFGRTDIAVACHILNRPQVLFLKPCCYDALPDLRRMCGFWIQFTSCIIEVQQTVSKVFKTVNADTEPLNILFLFVVTWL